jgi:hypothetical protein
LNHRKFLALFACIPVFAVAASTVGPLTPVYAQIAGATLSGTVTDQSGSVVPGAEVSIKNTASGIVVTVTANSDGFYSAPNLQPGMYEVTTSASGFATNVHSGIDLTVGAKQVLNTSLGVGEISQRVEVTGEAPAIELTSSAISGVVNSTTVVELPLNGRDWTLLSTLQPGVNTIGTQQPIGASSVRGNRGYGNQVTVTGTRPQNNNYRIDGVSVVDYSGGGPGSAAGYAIGVDAVAEFSVMTSNYSAEYGRTSGGVINAITRSGTNDFHGDVYGFLRAARLDARSYFDQGPPPPFHRDQFGGSLGGPILKNKTFFFVDYEGFRQGQGNTATDRVPNATARTGLIHLTPAQQAVDTDCVSTHNPSDPNACQLTVDPSVATYLSFYPQPNGSALNPDVSQYIVAINNVVHDNFVTTRIDHQLTAKDSLYGMFLYDKGINQQPDVLDQVLSGNTSTRYTVALQETHTFTPSLTNSVRFGFNRVSALSNQSIAAINPLAAQLGLGAFDRQASNVAVSGLTVFSGGINGLSYPFHYWNTFQAYDDGFLIKGNHSIKFGFSFERDQHNAHFSLQSNGNFTFGTLYSLLTNRPKTFSGSPSGLAISGLRQSIVGAYVQDDWKFRPNLTVNLGLRYEMSTVPTESQNKLVNLESLTAPASTLGAPLFLNPTLRNFEPRVGFAWDPFRNGKTSVRGAFGLFDVLPLTPEFFIMEEESAPNLLDIAVGNLAKGDFPAGLNGLSADPSKLQTAWIEHHPKRNYIMIWNLNVQQQITSKMSASLGYVGHHGVHMYNREDDINTVLPTQTSIGLLFPLNGTVLNPNVGEVRGGYWGGTSLYDALEASFTRNLSHGVQAQASYTWAKGFDTGSATAIGDPFTNSIASPFNFWPGRRGLSDYNIDHTFILSFIWDLPTHKNWSGVASHLLDGWELGGILTAESGQPFTPLIGGDPLGLNSADPWAFPNVTPGCHTTNPGNPGNYLNLSCFTLPTAPASFASQCNDFAGAATPPPAGQVYCSNLLGNEVRNSVIGPGFYNLDFSVFKNNRIRAFSETLNVQIRAEFFNVLNHASFLEPINNSVIFDQTGAPQGADSVDQLAVPAREIQFGLKVIW